MHGDQRRVVDEVVCTYFSPQVWRFDLDGEEYHWNRRTKMLTHWRDGKSSAIGLFGRLCFAVYFCQGAHDGSGLAERSQWVKVVMCR